MAFNDDLTWEDWTALLGSDCRNAIQHTEVGLRQYDEWQSFRAGRTNAAIATALGRAEADIAKMDAAYAAFKEVHDFADNVAGPLQGDRFYAWRQFS